MLPTECWIVEGPLYVYLYTVELLNILPGAAVAVPWLFGPATSVVVDFVVVVVSTCTVVVKEESVPTIHNGRIIKAVYACIPGKKNLNE